MDPVPPDPDSRRQMDRPQPLPEGQRARGATGPRERTGQDQLSSHTQKKSRKKCTHKTQKQMKHVRYKTQIGFILNLSS